MPSAVGDAFARSAAAMCLTMLAGCQLPLDASGRDGGRMHVRLDGGAVGVRLDGGSVISEDAGAIEVVPRIAVLPDTQCYSLYYPAIFQAQGDFLLDGADDLDIRAAIHLGDITETNTAEQWATARDALAPLYGRMPLAIAPGNHDLGPYGSALDRSTLFGAFFPSAEISEAPGFVEAFEEATVNTAWEFFGTRQAYLLIALEFAPRAAVLDWAADVLARFPGHIGIVSTHAYLDAEGRRYDHLDDTLQPFCPYEYGVASVDASDGEEIFRRLVAPSSNVRLVLSGHVPNGFAHTVATTDDGAEVQQVMVDYQTGTRCPETGGDGRGYLLLLELRERDDAVDVLMRSYSPWEGAHRDEHELRFTLSAP